MQSPLRVGFFAPVPCSVVLRNSTGWHSSDQFYSSRLRVSAVRFGIPILAYSDNPPDRYFSAPKARRFNLLAFMRMAHKIVIDHCVSRDCVGLPVQIQCFECQVNRNPLGATILNASKEHSDPRRRLHRAIVPSTTTA